MSDLPAPVDTLSESPPDVLAPVPTEGTYWVESRRPLSSLVFILPLLLAYEVGLLVLGHHAVRNGADAMLRHALDGIGFGQYYLLPLLTVSILLGWHHTTRQSWRLSRGVLSGMLAESALMALCLRLVLQLQGALFQQILAPTMQVSGGFSERLSDTVAQGVGFLGAGIYEELLFRLILVPSALAAFVAVGVPKRASLAAAIVVTSLIFSAAHYVGPYGDALQWFSFLFRFLAGVFFAVLFVYRGFGVAAGAHAGYDILVGLFHT